jgi:uncharacterized protein (DUF1800 family)
MSLSRPAMSAIRFGYGIRPGEPVADGADALLAQLDAGMAEAPRFPTEGIDGRWHTIEHYYATMAGIPKGKEARRMALRPVRKEIFHANGRDQHARVAQAAFSANGFHERLATFWTDHFAVSVRKQRPMYLYTSLYEAEAIRRHMAGPFSGLLRAAVNHPAMLIYLDQVKSMGPNSRRGRRNERGLNENLGRELLELHTLGIGSGYSQADVRAAALVLTGLNVERENGRATFRAHSSEPGPIEVPFLGRSYGEKLRTVEDIHAMLDDLASHPATAQHICRKLVVHFCSDEPPIALVKAMVDAWQASGGNLRDVYAAMLNHPAVWEDPGRKARQPFDYVVAGLRASGLPETEFTQPDRPVNGEVDDDGMMAITPEVAEKRRKRAEKAMNAGDTAEMQEDRRPREKLRPLLNPLTVGAVKKLGQPVWEPASPEGTEEEFSAWISSTQLVGRIEWAQRVSNRVGNDVEPVALARSVLRDAARDDTLKVVSQAPSRRSGLSLLLASPEFNRR